MGDLFTRRYFLPGNAEAMLLPFQGPRCVAGSALLQLLPWAREGDAWVSSKFGSCCNSTKTCSKHPPSSSNHTDWIRKMVFLSNLSFFWAINKLLVPPKLPQVLRAEAALREEGFFSFQTLPKQVSQGQWQSRWDTSTFSSQPHGFSLSRTSVVPQKRCQLYYTNLFWDGR